MLCVFYFVFFIFVFLVGVEKVTEHTVVKTLSKNQKTFIFIFIFEGTTGSALALL